MAKVETTIKPDEIQPTASPPENANAVATHRNQLPAEYDFGEDAGAGMEDLRREEFKLPIFRILDAKSPQCKDPAEGGIEGARAGMILNTATGEIFDGRKGIGFIPVRRDYNFVEYITINDGKGFVGIHAPNDPIVLGLLKEQGPRKKLKRFDVVVAEAKDGNPEVRKNTEIVETYYLFGLLLIDEETVIMGVVPFSSTQIPKYQAFITRYDSIKYRNPKGDLIKPPLWAHKWHLATRPEKNSKGDFQGWIIRLKEEPPRKSLMRLDDPLYQQGKAYHELIASGAGKVDREADAKAGGETPQQGDEEIPF
jgi:hypothetical protein